MTYHNHPTQALGLCPDCNGAGRVETGEMEHGPAGIGYETADCETCDGTGSAAS